MNINIDQEAFYLYCKNNEPRSRGYCVWAYIAEKNPFCEHLLFYYWSSHRKTRYVYKVIKSIECYLQNLKFYDTEDGFSVLGYFGDEMEIHYFIQNHSEFMVIKQINRVLNKNDHENVYQTCELFYPLEIPV